MSDELEGQMPLFTLDGCTSEVQNEYADEVCKQQQCAVCTEIAAAEDDE